MEGEGFNPCPPLRSRASGALRAELASGALLVLRRLRCCERVPPAPVHALVDEHLRTGVPERTAERNALRRVLLHPFERAVLERCAGPGGFADRNIEELRDAAGSRPPCPASGARSGRTSRSAAREPAHQLRTFSQNGQNGWPSRSIQSRQYCRMSSGRRLDRRAHAPRRVVQRLVPGLDSRSRGGCTCSRPRRGRRGRCRGTSRRGENRSASIGRCVFRKRRCVCASTSGSFTAFGGTRRSSHGDISATRELGSPSKSSWPTICCIQVVPDFA